jgi:hypothetical protein
MKTKSALVILNGILNDAESALESIAFARYRSGVDQEIARKYFQTHPKRSVKCNSCGFSIPRISVEKESGVCFACLGVGRS